MTSIFHIVSLYFQVLTRFCLFFMCTIVRRESSFTYTASLFLLLVISLEIKFSVILIIDQEYRWQSLVGQTSLCQLSVATSVIIIICVSWKWRWWSFHHSLAAWGANHVDRNSPFSEFRGIQAARVDTDLHAWLLLLFFRFSPSYKSLRSHWWCCGE